MKEAFIKALGPLGMFVMFMYAHITDRSHDRLVVTFEYMLFMVFFFLTWNMINPFRGSKKKEMVVDDAFELNFRAADFISGLPFVATLRRSSVTVYTNRRIARVVHDNYIVFDDGLMLKVTPEGRVVSIGADVPSDKPVLMFLNGKIIFDSRRGG